MSLFKQILAVLIIGIFAAGAWVQLSPDAAPSTDPGASSAGAERGGVRGGRGMRGGGGREPSRVITTEVAEAEAGSRLVAIGTAEAARSVMLHPQTGGIVSEVSFAAGDRVSAGSALVRLDDAEERIAVERAQIALEAAEETLSRYERLAGSQSIPAVQVQEARVAAASARNELAAAELALSRRTLTAPFDGIMGFAEIEAGDMISTADPIGAIDDRTTLNVSFQVPERYAAMIEHGMPVTATTAAHGDERFMGEISGIDSRVDPATRSLRVRAGLDNFDDRLRPGMAFQVTADFATPGRPAVPLVSVQWDRDGAYVFKVVDGRAQRTRVEVIARTREAVLVSGDITPADLVVAEGLDGLRDGAEVAMVEADSADAADDATQL